MKQKTSASGGKFTYWLSVIIIGVALGLALQFVRAWTEPTAAPPNGNIGAPINTGDLAQGKTGPLLVNGVNPYNSSWGLLVPNGNVGIGTASPGYKLDVAGYINTSAGGAYGNGGVRFGYQTLSSNPSWLYVGDQNGSIYGGQGIAMDNLWAANNAYIGAVGGWVSDFLCRKDGTNCPSTSGLYLPLAGGVMNASSRVGFNGSPITDGSAYGIGNGAAYPNPGSIAVDTLETDGGAGGSGTLELNYYGGNAVTIGPGGTKPLYAAIMYDGNDTGFRVDPNGNSQLGAVYATDWFRAQGNTGLYFQDHGGGLYMSDNYWIRTYNNNGIYTGGEMQAGTVRANSQLIAANAFQMPKDAGAGKVLTSDAAGNATWAGGGSCPSGFTDIKSGSYQLGCMQTAEQGSGSNYFTAENTCFTTYGGRLPFYSEWYIAMNNYNLTNETDDWEWVGDEDNNPSGRGCGTAGLNAITQISAVDPANTTDAIGSILAYRCWVDPR